MRRLASLPTLMLFALMTIVSACDGGWRSSTRGDLAGSSWRLIGWQASSLAASDFTITVTFKDREIGGTSAVNQYGGTYLAGDGDFSTRDMSSTEIAGPEPAMRAEGIYMQLLRDARQYKRTGARLTLLDANANELLYFAPAK